MEYVMKKTIVVLAAGSALVSAPALAQEVDSTFTGPRVEAIVGYDMSKAGSSVDDDFNDNNDQSIDGLLYGVGIGYDFSMGGIVAGIEGEFTDSMAKSTVDAGDVETLGFGRVKANRDLYVGARVGAKIGPQMLLYGKGGYTNAKFDVLASDGVTEFNRDIDADGWRIGVGAEYAMTEKSFAKLEYRYSNYSKGEFDFSGDIPDSDRFNIDTDRHQVVASVGLRF